MIFDAIFQMTKKPKKGKNLKSRNIYFQWDLHCVLTALSNIWIIKKEFTSDKISAFVFISLKYDAWECSFSPIFYVEDFFNWYKTIDLPNNHERQSAPPWSTCTFDRLINSFSVNFILTILFTTCKMGIRPWVIDFRFGRGISGR